jgi:hypothetical protein
VQEKYWPNAATLITYPAASWYLCSW